ncbi:MAG: Gfo/Idh/MocA family oxidoreductase [Algoriphagus sp.]|uniref:Gfo/Idh/MocA family protein n=1 Tax=Algoriphagus sp. TaxID=1872435 RepID=UPI00272F9A36|nr:Gfo/Idh/MocA family oxidoreductase [Algoriphagus sp.]MDP2040460.1 Gfo/Idh/MocA family oxidoreductase [Algoriphagus sp.]MDP3472149.1 Gfo/Idh/MocA family oxidoreductase [Algoriphagus sp.]
MTHRRSFLKQSSLIAGGLWLAPSLIQAKQKIPPSARIRVALIGCNNMGFGILRHHIALPEVDCVAICDVDQNILDKRIAEVETATGKKPQRFTDFRKLLELKDLDAVIIGTPDHWHCLIAVAACQAGKDVYVEKPMANSIGECDLMAQAAGKYNRIMQVGQQQRAGKAFIESKDLVKSGYIGKIRKVNIWSNFNYGLGNEIKPATPVPQGVDYDFWLGPAPKREFNPNRFHGSWRHFWDYGGGLMSDWGVHLLDMAIWVEDNPSAPGHVMTYAANVNKENRDRDTFDTMNVLFPKKDFLINYDMNGGLQTGPYGKPYGIAYVGDLGTLVVNRSGYEIYPEWDPTAKANKIEAKKLEGTTESHNVHVANFVECIKTRNEPNCPPEAGRIAALHAHIPNIAARVGAESLIWDDAKREFVGNREANELIFPEYRKPWVLPKV